MKSHLHDVNQKGPGRGLHGLGTVKVQARNETVPVGQAMFGPGHPERGKPHAGYRSEPAVDMTLAPCGFSAHG